MKPKKKKAGKLSFAAMQGKKPWIPMTQEHARRLLLAESVFFSAVSRAGMGQHCIPPKMISDSIRFLAAGKPLVFTHVGEDFIVCDPRTYAQMVGK